MRKVVENNDVIAYMFEVPNMGRISGFSLSGNCSILKHLTLIEVRRQQNR